MNLRTPKLRDMARAVVIEVAKIMIIGVVGGAIGGLLAAAIIRTFR